MGQERLGLTIRVSGRFRIEDAEGREVTVTSAKGKALIALLATQSGYERGRIWLQDKLWSERGSESGARSLRQELTQLRKQLGRHSALLVADRQAVRLDAKCVTVVDTCTEAGEEFLEGLDVRDDEFNHWLVSERTRRTPPEAENAAWAPRKLSQSGSPEVAVSVIALSTEEATCRVIEAQVLDRTARALSDFCAVTTYAKRPVTMPPADFQVTVQAFQQPGRDLAIRATLEEVSLGRTLLAETVVDVSATETPDIPWPILALVNRVVATTTRAISAKAASGGGRQSAAALASRAIHGIFSIGRAELVAADKLLKEAHDIDPRGVFSAWRLQLSIIQYVERYELDRQALCDKGEELCAEAIAQDPLNSNVMAAAANFQAIMEKNAVAGVELARLSIRANSANPLAWWAFSNAVQYTGDAETAYLAARRAHNLARGTKLEFWAAFQRSLSAALVRKPEEALHLGEISNALAPNFAPPLRYLLALYSNLDDVESARRVLKNLERMEADFSLDRIVHDPEYPMSIARSAGLLDANKLELSKS